MTVAIIGGDRRMLYAAEAFLHDGARVCAAGFETAVIPAEGSPAAEGSAAVGSGLLITAPDEALRGADIAVLPVRPVKGELLNAPLSAQPIRLSELGALIGDIPVFCGDAEGVRPYCRGAVYDYTVREEFAVRNAVLTAEGALAQIIGAWPGAINGTPMLVIGYGRIGRILAGDLRSLGARVTVAARSETSRAWAQAQGLEACSFPLSGLGRYRVLINTVPATVLNAGCMAQMHRDALILDLASAPGGADRQAAKEFGMRCLSAPGLPGTTAPAAAGQIIKDTIQLIIKEENGGKDSSRLRDDRLLLHL